MINIHSIMKSFFAAQLKEPNICFQLGDHKLPVAHLSIQIQKKKRFKNVKIFVAFKESMSGVGEYTPK